jgi:hypothetical protein
MFSNVNKNKLPPKRSTLYNLCQKVCRGVGGKKQTKEDTKGRLTLFEQANLFRTRRI